MEDLRMILKENGIQVTRQRLQIFQILRELNTHLTVDDVVNELAARQITLTTASVYNILNFFEKKGLIMKINTAGEPVIYDVNTHRHMHVCDSETRAVVDYDDRDNLLKVISDYIADHPIKGLDLERIDVNFIGHMTGETNVSN